MANAELRAFGSASARRVASPGLCRDVFELPGAVIQELVGDG